MTSCSGPTALPSALRNSLFCAASVLAFGAAGAPVFAATVQQPGVTAAEAAPQNPPGGPAAASAPQTPAPSENRQDVVVTGSRIRGVAPVGANVVAISQQEVQKAGVNTTADLVREIPQITNIGGFSETGGGNQGGASNTSRANGLNLRGIGPAATLTLINSRRVVPSGVQGQLVDPNIIPSLALERVEVVPDGSSAIYGSDAIAGVVNFITRRRYNGLELQARGAWGDVYSEYQYAFVGGKTWDRARLVLSGEYSGHSRLMAADRDFITSEQRPFGGRDFRSNQCAPGNIIVGSQVYPIPFGGVTSASQLTAGAPNRCDNVRLGSVLPKVSRASLLGTAEVDLTESITAFAEGLYSRRTFLTPAGPTATTLVVPRSNPFFVSPVPGATSVQVAYLLGALTGNSYQQGEARTEQATAGLRFRLPGAWRAEAAYTHGESNERETSRPTLNAPALNALLANPDPTQALNPFGGAVSAPIPGLFAKLYTSVFLPFGRPKLDSWNAQADGPVFTLPGGQVRVAAGAEYRKESFYGGLFAGLATAPVEQSFRASRNIKSVYGEVFIPIVGSENAIPLVRALNLSLAARREDYSDFGVRTNPKVGATWTVVDGLNLRGSWGKSFRAPSFQENTLRSSGFGIYPQNFSDPLSPTGLSTGFSIAGGNTEIQPETAKTRSVGFDLQPPSIPGLRVSATYFDINYTNQIFFLQGNNQVLTIPAFAPYVIRNPTAAQIAAYLNFGGSPVPINGVLPPNIQFIVDGRRFNFGTTQTNGIDYDIRYRWMTEAGDFNVGIAGTHVTRLQNSFAPAAPLQNVLGLLNWPLKDRFRAELGWTRGIARASLFANYASSFRNNSVSPVYRVKSLTTFDANVAVDIDHWIKGVRLNANVLNLFNSPPPHANLASGYDPQTANPIGRLFAFTVNKRF